MRELKAGDKVKIRSDLELWRNYGGLSFPSALESFRGKEVIISLIEDDETFNIVDGGGWFLNKQMIEEPSYTDAVNSPPHCLHGGIETIEVIRMMLTPEEFKGYCKGNIIKYRERAPYNGNEEEDYAKALKYKEILEDL